MQTGTFCLVTIALALLGMLSSTAYSQSTILPDSSLVRSSIAPQQRPEQLSATETNQTIVNVQSLDEWLAESRSKSPTWFRAEYDFDNRGFNVLHFMGSAPLPLGMSIWGFIDLEGSDLFGTDREETSRYFLEIDLKKKCWNGGGLLFEVNDLQGDGNQIGRFGFYHQPDLSWILPGDGLFAGKRFLQFKVFPVETDRRGWQAAVAWNKNFDSILDGRISTGGFFDLNYNAGLAQDHTIIVSESQIRYRLVEKLHVIVEFRFNEFLQDDFGIAPGIQYRF